MAYQVEPSPQSDPAEGFRVAGIFDLLKMAERLGIDVTDIAGAARRNDPQAWFDNKAFVGPSGRVSVEVPSGIDAGDLQQYPTLGALVQRAPSVEDYLSGSELGRALGPSLSDYKVGVAPLGGSFRAGVTAPEYVDLPDGSRRLLQPGFMAVDPNYMDDAAGLIEHEMTHVGQNVLGSPVGTNQADASLLVDYINSIGRSPVEDLPGQIKSLVPPNQAGQVPTMKYLHSMGEAEARAAQVRADNPALQAVAPTVDQYKWNPAELPVNSSLFYENYPGDINLARDWWRNQWNKGGQQ